MMDSRDLEWWSAFTVDSKTVKTICVAAFRKLLKHYKRKHGKNIEGF